MDRNGKVSLSETGVTPADNGSHATENGRVRPGRRSAADRSRAVLELLSGKATIDQLAQRFGVKGATIEAWRDEALQAIDTSMRQGPQVSPREKQLEKKLHNLEKAFTDLAIRHELVTRALEQRPSPPGKSKK